MDCSSPGSSVHGISQPRILEWVVISLPRKSPLLSNGTCISCIASGFFTTEPANFFFPPGRRKWQSTLVFLPGKSRGQKSLEHCSSWSHRVGDEWMTRALEDLLKATDLFIPQKNTHMVIPCQIQLQGIYTKGSPERILFPYAYEMTTIWIFQLGNWKLVLIIRRGFSCLLNSPSPHLTRIVGFNKIHPSRRQNTEEIG